MDRCVNFFGERLWWCLIERVRVKESGKERERKRAVVFVSMRKNE